ncbi:right-handed parallel beta-helix repeat-containing protein [bacterium]|nr:right-handed parallel beta-helix repeat-containing protein [bacterium]
MRPEIRVGLTEGDLCGSDHRVLQAAVDHLAGLGGGTVHIGPGTWTLRNSVVLRSGVTLIGAGEKTVLRKAPGGVSLLAEDGDYGDVRILPKDASDFQVSDGVTVRSDRFAGFFSTVATVIRKEADGALVLDDRLNADLMVTDGASVSRACPLIRATDQRDVAIRDLAIEGNREACPPEDGCRGGGINLLRVAGVTISHVAIRNMNGDGLSYQNCPDVVVEDCVFERNTGGGCHPGSGSARPIVRHCVMRGNGGCGLFLCWRVKNGLFEDNLIEDNAQMGISIGHKDTDNRFARNTIRRNRLSGVYFRNEPPYAAGHRCVVEACVIQDNGSGGEHDRGPAAAIRIDGETDGIILRRNTVVGTPVSLLVGPKVGAVTVEGDLPGTITDLRPKQ